MVKQSGAISTTQISVENWDQADFITYLYLLMADADCETTEDEKIAIEDKMNKLIGIFYPENGYSYKKSLSIVKEAVQSQQLKAWDVIPSMLEKFYFNADIKRHILQDLTELMSADEEVTTPEYNTLLFIRRYFTENG
ncbi:MAG: hypothetical protein K2Q22_14695 [Cytophagales bacterium]|nr:hypothetical protein [Cytophagales bacterium]